MRYLLLVLFVFIGSFSYAQEFQCSVNVVSPGIQGTNKRVFETLQKAITEFMNNQTWTTDIYQAEERIICNIHINIREVISNDEFKGSIQVQASRPVFNSSYNTVLINHKDEDMHFRYVEYEPLIFNPNTFDSNLVAVLSYYAYMILGLDYDSFELNGGTPYFQKAENIVSRAQQASQSGWKSFENRRNRYWMTENVLNNYHKPLRQCFYEYHMKGLDRMSDKIEDARADVLKALEMLRKVHRQEPGTIMMQVFFNAKADEIVNIFSESFSMEKGRVVSLLKEIDPANAKKYEKITSGETR
ncbi:DUF4835 family protein [Marinilabiliaceae bacterium JC017]|nr:DUF4835 family protein [Marinilabiliaceae bacterium JC017]